MFSSLGRRTCESRVALPPKGSLRQLATPLGTIFRDLGLLNLVQYHDFPFCRFPFVSLMFLYITLGFF